MAAIVTDQFRILNANNFVETIDNSTNSYYVVVGLVNPTTPVVGFGRSENWNTDTPNPLDNFNYTNHVGDTMTFGKKVTADNVRRLISRRNWTQGTRYEMYRHDYSLKNPSPITGSSRLYDANYYVMNQNFDVYICIDNGSSGISTTGNASQDEPLFTDLEPTRAGESGDGYIWKYLFTVPPSDIIKFDSTEYISVPSDWPTSTTTQIQAVRENGDSTINNNQIKKVYIDQQGFGYTQNQTGKELDIENNYSKFMEVAEQVKRVLSVRDKQIEMIYGPDGAKEIEITRAEFEQSIQTHIEKLKMLMEEALDGSGLKPENISHTLLVGCLLYTSDAADE